MSDLGSTAKLIGARVRRVEDPRVLLGRTRYVDDVQLPGASALAFLRSPHAHARIGSIDLEAARQAPGVQAALTAADLEGFLPPLRLEYDSSSGRPPCRDVVWPVLASGKARFVGEAVVAIVAERRDLAEDACERVEIEWEPLEPVVDVGRAAHASSPRVHEEWPDNVYQHVERTHGDVAGAFRSAAVVVSERIHSGRHLALPLEGRALLASWDPSSESLTVWASTQMPHVLRSELAQALGLGEHAVRVIAADVGGGFGLKSHVFPEEVLAAALPRRLGRPVKWIEDRREHLAASQHARDEIVAAELALARDGTMLGLRAHAGNSQRLRELGDEAILIFVEVTAQIHTHLQANERAAALAQGHEALTRRVSMG